MEISASLRKLVRSLASARHRRETGLFVAEGTKCVLDILPRFRCRWLFADSQWIAQHPSECASLPVAVASRADLERMTALSTPAPVIAVFEIPSRPLDLDSLAGELVIALDRVQDPGNLGTIVRVADWMGVRHILASPDTADIWNPKVVQSTMGSIARVAVSYVDLPDVLPRLSAMGMDVYGTFLEGDSIYRAPLSPAGVVVMGNEGSGVAAPVAACVTRKLFIPPYPPGADTAESLNVAVATAITLSEFRRRL